jgi:hypothetical protein
MDSAGSPDGWGAVGSDGAVGVEEMVVRWGMGGMSMPFIAIEPCCKCGRPIDLKKVKTYRVREDYRLICEECLKKEPRHPGPEEERKGPAEKKR